MQKQTELRLEPWTVIVAIVVVALVAFMALRMGGGMGSMGMNPQAMMTQLMAGIDKAAEQVDGALAHMDEASKASDLPTLQKHLQLGQGALEGQGSALMDLQMLQGMMKGPMMTMAQQGMAGMSMAHHADMMTALEAAQSSIKSALGHFAEALKADKLETAQEEVRLGIEPLRAAKGTAGSADPKTGGLTYMKERMAQMMGPMK